MTPLEWYFCIGAVVAGLRLIKLWLLLPEATKARATVIGVVLVNVLGMAILCPLWPLVSLGIVKDYLYPPKLPE